MVATTAPTTGSPAPDNRGKIEGLLKRYEARRAPRARALDEARKKGIIDDFLNLVSAGSTGTTTPTTEGASPLDKLRDRLGIHTGPGGRTSTAEGAAGKINIDTVVAWDIRRDLPYAGLGWVLSDPGNKLRVSVQAAPERIGLGVGYVVKPVLDIAIGPTVFRDFKDDTWGVGVFASIFRW